MRPYRDTRQLLHAAPESACFWRSTPEAPAFVAYLSVLCNTRYTGTQFALFTSFMAFGRSLLSASSGRVVEVTGWFQFFLISTLVALPGLLLLLWMIKKLPMARQSSHSDTASLR